ncbi:hypothetical protein KDI_48720 [Dictyobacter arantiisoli]|uniref:Haem-binding uptake Tiki superfamily ChaN domain-containing protein n=2 Tax=Dictyobacter arantiisoli TaxID=2014874 RepID=A0A5A5TJA7_9CHLR|nr:hypothetical protein KDI_48720 [Dictyobacter arantiisoli]
MILTRPASAPVKTQQAIQGILDALSMRPLVAISEAHQLQEEHDLLTGLLYHPTLPTKINDIVVEFGNPLYQESVDRFIAGEPVANEELRQVWRNTGISGSNPVWDAPVYEQFFHKVRAVNAQLPAARRLRVLLGDAPIDWSKLQQRDQWIDYVRQRDAHYADVIEHEVLQKGRHALLLAGGNHFLRGAISDGDPSLPVDQAPPNVSARIERRHPRSMYIIDLLMTKMDNHTPAGRQIATFAHPSLIPLAQTWLGDQTTQTSLGTALPRSAMADATLYLGPVDKLTASRADPTLYTGGAYAKELQRRGRLLYQWGIQDARDPLAADIATANLGPSYIAQPQPQSKTTSNT